MDASFTSIYIFLSPVIVFWFQDVAWQIVAGVSHKKFLEQLIKYETWKSKPPHVFLQSNPSPIMLRQCLFQIPFSKLVSHEKK